MPEFQEYPKHINNPDGTYFVVHSAEEEAAIKEVKAIEEEVKPQSDSHPAA